MGGGLYLESRPPIEITYSQDDLLYDSGEPGFYLDLSCSASYIMTPETTLPKGFYDLKMDVEYQGGAASKAEALYCDRGYRNQLTGLMSLPFPETDFRIQYDDPVVVRARLTGDATEGDYVLIRSVRIVSDKALTVRHTVFCYTVLFLCVDMLLALAGCQVFSKMTEEQKRKIMQLLLLIFFTSWPIMAGYLTNAHDLPFHLTRIEGIKKELLNGNFPARLQTFWLHGYGYPVSVFYGDLLLYIPAILRIFGISLQTSYQFYLLLINAGTVFITYACFSKMSNEKIGMVCAAVFSMNIYRQMDIWTRAAVGEYTALMFMPLVLYGMWCIYACPEDSKEFAGGWKPLTVGCTGLFLSHVLSTEMVAVLMVAVALILGKRTFQKKTFLALCKAALASLLLCLWFLVPFLDYVLSDKYFITDFSGYWPYYLEVRGVLPIQLFMNVYSVGGESLGVQAGAADEMPLTLGYASLLILAAWLLLCFGKQRGWKEKKEEYLAAGFSVLCMILSLSSFPYTWIAQKLPFTQFFFRSIQYPWRFLAPAGVFCVWLLCIILKKEWLSKKMKYILSGLLVFLALWQGITYMSLILHEKSPYYCIRTGALTTGDVGNGEYLPAGGFEGVNEYSHYLSDNRDQLLYGDAVTVSEWHRDKGSLYMTVSNQNDGTQEVVLPILKYKGYRAFSQDGLELQIVKGEQNRISVVLPPLFEGGVRVAFYEPWYWRLSELISLCTLLGLLLFPVLRRYKISG